MEAYAGVGRRESCPDTLGPVREPVNRHFMPCVCDLELLPSPAHMSPPLMLRFDRASGRLRRPVNDPRQSDVLASRDTTCFRSVGAQR
jgi:hypothetical protein